MFEFLKKIFGLKKQEQEVFELTFECQIEREQRYIRYLILKLQQSIAIHGREPIVAWRVDENELPRHPYDTDEARIEFLASRFHILELIKQINFN